MDRDALTSGLRFGEVKRDSNSENLEQAVTVDFKNPPPPQGPGSVDPRFPTALPFPVPD